MDDSVLTERLRSALRSGADLPDEREALCTLLDVYALHLAPITDLDGAATWQHHPDVAALKGTLEARFRARLGDVPCPVGDDPAESFRRLARDDVAGPVYEWLAADADRDELIEFISLEGGPDADFDDLVALCQIGLVGLPKLTLARNYWDEMGRGELSSVHTELHRDMVRALRLRAVPVDELPTQALERKALNGYLATNRALQPELLGSLGLIECQAGPRCRKVAAGMRRLGLPAGALPFYEEHATADPRHGKDWVAQAIVPLVDERPEWGPRIRRGAQWRATVNRDFFVAMARSFGVLADAA
ncbi:MAG TPA: iron-containing redox enzyme family protein [Acidimicrobiia bacterium]|nr:iron-containing redox enzyme family protein [Acidimicrobiia bacterium]